jgi:hypothetical protein
MAPAFVLPGRTRPPHPSELNLPLISISKPQAVQRKLAALEPIIVSKAMQSHLHAKSCMILGQKATAESFLKGRMLMGCPW